MAPRGVRRSSIAPRRWIVERDSFRLFHLVAGRFGLSFSTPDGACRAGPLAPVRCIINVGVPLAADCHSARASISRSLVFSPYFCRFRVCAVRAWQAPYRLSYAVHSYSNVSLACVASWSRTATSAPPSEELSQRRRAGIENVNSTSPCVDTSVGRRFPASVIPAESWSAAVRAVFRWHPYVRRYNPALPANNANGNRGASCPPLASAPRAIACWTVAPVRTFLSDGIFSDVPALYSSNTVAC